MAFVIYLVAAAFSSWTVALGGGRGWAVEIFDATARLLFSGLLVWALGGLAGELASEKELELYWVDVGLVVAAGSVLLLSLGPPPLLAQGPISPADLAVLSMQSATGLLLLLALAALLPGRRAVEPLALAPLLAALAAELAADVLLARAPPSGFWGRQELPLYLRLVAGLCFALWAYRGSRDGARLVGVSGERREGAHLLPYLVFVGASACLVVQLWHGRGEGGTRIVLSLGALAAVMFLRQVLLDRGGLTQPVREVIRKGEDRLRALLTNSSDLILVLSPDGAIRYLSPSVRRVLGFDATRLWAPALHEFVHPDDLPRVNHLLHKVTQEISGLSFREEWRMRDEEGSWHHVEGIIANQLGEPGVHGLLLNVRDISERKVLEAKLAHLALHDSLTGLANRTLLLDRTQQALAQARRRGEQVALLFLDLDDFKQVNDTLGHPEGDRLLKEIATRVVASCRAADTVARLGGDEFAVLLEGSVDFDSVTLVADRILEQLRLPYRALHGQFIPTTSIGLVLADGDMAPEELLRRADVAMYAAKANGKNGRCQFQPEMDRPLKKRLRLEADLRLAVRESRLAVHYQPIVGLETEAIAGVEALVRWEHPELGTLEPKDFLGLAEDAGLIASIDQAVLLEACTEVAGWRGLEGSPAGLFVSVNLSGAELLHPDLLAHVVTALKKSRLAPRSLILEVTEDALIGDQALFGARLRDIEKLGVRIAIDDFGVHYSSLSYLRNLPVHVLKLDQSFVADLRHDEKSRHIVRAVTELAGALEVQVIAEGIEQSEQRDELLKLGCSWGQGFFFHPPKPGYEVRAMLRGEVAETAAFLPEEPSDEAASDRARNLVAQLDPLSEEVRSSPAVPLSTLLPAQL